LIKASVSRKLSRQSIAVPAARLTSTADGLATFAEASRRVNLVALLKPPADLSNREITLMDYWISR
jgi:hypothetical protein